MGSYIKSTGFTAPAERTLCNERRTVALAQLAATAGLAVCTLVAVTAVSVGIARASIVGGVIDNEGSLFAIALLLGLVFIGIGGFTILPPSNRRHRH